MPLSFLMRKLEKQIVNMKKVFDQEWARNLIQQATEKLFNK